MLRKTIPFVLVGLFCFSTLSAHEKHKEARRDTMVQSGDSLTIAAQRLDTIPYRIPPMKEALLHHLHNKIVHLPIGFGWGAALLFLLAVRWPELHKAGLLLALLGAAFAVAAYFSGQAQEEAFEGTSKEWVVELHEKIGIATAISLWVLVLFGFWKPLKRFAWLWGLVALALISAAGFYGGLLAHG
jgi:uncharacterized membrane protein